MLQDQLEKQTRDYKQQIEAKIQERNQLADQYNYIREKDMDKVKTVSEKSVFCEYYCKLHLVYVLNTKLGQTKLTLCLKQ